MCWFSQIGWSASIICTKLHMRCFRSYMQWFSACFIALGSYPQSWARTQKMQPAHPVVCLLNYLCTQFHTHLTTCTPKLTKLAHPKKYRYLHTKKVLKWAILRFGSVTVSTCRFTYGTFSKSLNTWSGVFSNCLILCGWTVRLHLGRPLS